MGQSEDCGCGAPAFRVVKQGLVMAPPRARMTNDRSTVVIWFVRYKDNDDWHGLETGTKTKLIRRHSASCVLRLRKVKRWRVQ